jgi:hypothetical protein
LRRNYRLGCYDRLRLDYRLGHYSLHDRLPGDRLDSHHRLPDHGLYTGDRLADYGLRSDRLDRLHNLGNRLVSDFFPDYPAAWF